jgi:signal transduction histidine kinase
VLFQDVTAERRHRDELISFAGVVAHDLLNPLATVEGWTEATTDTLHDALRAGPHHPAMAEALDNLVRIARASTRMHVLINDLLAHTTARDATIAPAPVDLRDLVGDIVAARVDAATAAGQPVPRFIVEALPAVHADQVLVRQLLDNLIGNAIKYVAPGVAPVLAISATKRDDTVEVTIADNGIGIPAGEHAAIFGNFHRAHRTGYAGTGLGLAICKRIVERHGGTITATDNPGGGSRFTFTLPASHIDATDRATVFS